MSTRWRGEPEAEQDRNGYAAEDEPVGSPSGVSDGRCYAHRSLNSWIFPPPLAGCRCGGAPKLRTQAHSRRAGERASGDDLRETRPKGQEDHGCVARATRCRRRHARPWRAVPRFHSHRKQRKLRAGQQREAAFQSHYKLGTSFEAWKAWIVSKEHPASLPPEGKEAVRLHHQARPRRRSPATRCARAQAPRKRSCRQARALEQDGNTLGRPAKSWVILVRRPPCAKAANLHPNCPRGS